jgi:tetratricopeptide (TPR) repeat protein
VPDVAPSAAQVRAALEELLGWQGISRSPQLSELLRYVVEKTLAGDEASIKAYSIAVDVFGRPQSFDPQADPIVRVQARRLRSLIEQFYDSGEASTTVRIRLPVGTYVPQFSFESSTGANKPGPTAREAQLPEVPMGERPRRQLSSRFLFNALLGLGFTLIGVALAVGLVRWMVPQARLPSTAAMPDYPAISVGSFDNLTGMPGLDDQIAQFGPRLARALSRFDALKIVPDSSGLNIHGAVQEDDGTFSVHALLSEGPASGIIWSTTIAASPGTDPATAIGDAVTRLAAQLGNATGPLHTPARNWLKNQTTLPANETLYLCELEYMNWRDSRRDADAGRAATCFDAVLAREPDNPVALAAAAGIRAWQVHYGSNPSADLPSLMVRETTAAARAVSLQPGDSFIYEQEGLVLARQGSVDAALGALNKAVELNPASMDAVAALGLVTWLTGSFDAGAALAEQALSSIPSPPPWYYMTRAFDALREKRYYDAIEAAQALTSGDDEYGPVIAVAAAPIIGRNDIIDRYKPQIVNNPAFQRDGVLPRIGLMIKPQILLDRVREGLVLAGIPPAALEGPFTPEPVSPGK